jgi:hypothetical protein
VRSRFDGYAAAAAFVVVAAALLFAREIANDFLWGHDGGNGAPFWNAARNSVRFGSFPPAKAYHGLTPPSPADYSIHHPLLLHAHLVVARLVLGSAEWAGRLVPWAYSVALVGLLYRTGARLFGRSFGLAASVLYVLTPMHLVFASMINHEQAGLFWTLATAYLAVRVLQRGGRRRFWAILACSSIALQLAWASYFVLAALGALVFLTTLRAPRSSARARARLLSFGLRGALAVNLALFFAGVAVAKGSLGDLGAAYSERSGAADGYLARSLDVRSISTVQSSSRSSWRVSFDSVNGPRKVVRGRATSSRRRSSSARSGSPGYSRTQGTFTPTGPSTPA